MLQQACGEVCLSRTQCHKWYQRFKSGRTSIEDDRKSGQPSTSMDDDYVQKVVPVIRQNPRPTVREVGEEVGICKSPCHLILTDKLQMRRVAAKFVPRLLTDALLIREFLTKLETTVVPQPPYSPDLTPADFFLFPKLKSTIKRSPISDDRRDKRKFAKGPSRHPTKHVSGRVPELEKTLGAVYQQ